MKPPKIQIIYLVFIAAAPMASPVTAQDSPPSATTDNPLGVIPGNAQPGWEPVENPYAGDATALQEGRQLFLDFNCYGCHGGYGGGGMAPSLRDVVWLYGDSAEDIFDSIAEGRRHSMPAWGTMLPDEQIWKLTAYIQSLGTEQEPQKPEEQPSNRVPEETP